MEYDVSSESYKEACEIVACVTRERERMEERMSESKREVSLQELYGRLVGLEAFPNFQPFVEKREFVLEGMLGGKVRDGKEREEREVAMEVVA